MKCVPGEEAVPLEYFCPICYVLVVRECATYCAWLEQQPAGEDGSIVAYGDTHLFPLMVTDDGSVVTAEAQLSDEQLARYRAALLWYELAQGVPVSEGEGPRTQVQLFEAAQQINSKMVASPLGVDL